MLIRQALESPTPSPEGLLRIISKANPQIRTLAWVLDLLVANILSFSKSEVLTTDLVIAELIRLLLIGLNRTEKINKTVTAATKGVLLPFLFLVKFLTRARINRAKQERIAALEDKRATIITKRTVTNFRKNFNLLDFVSFSR